MTVVAVDDVTKTDREPIRPESGKLVNMKSAKSEPLNVVRQKWHLARSLVEPGGQRRARIRPPKQCLEAPPRAMSKMAKMTWKHCWHEK
jgi:hypothetical protein